MIKFEQTNEEREGFNNSAKSIKKLSFRQIKKIFYQWEIQK